MARKEIPVSECIAMAVRYRDYAGVAIYGPDHEILTFIIDDDEITNNFADVSVVIGLENPIEVTKRQFLDFRSKAQELRIERV